MTIRSGGRARGSSQAHPADRGTYDEAWQPEYTPDAHGGGPWSRDRSGRGAGGGSNGWQSGRRRRRGIPGIIKFLLFALVLAAAVLLTLVTVLRPLVRDAVIGWATDNPAALGMPFIADLVREDLGPRLTNPASTDTTQVAFTINDGETASSIATRLQEDGFLADQRAFVFIATQRNLTGQLQTGSFILRKSMTPDQLVTALLAPEQIPYVEIGLRTGLRLEQITAKLETIAGLQMDPAEFYQLAKHPPASLVADYPWLKGVLPAGASLEGFLWPATYRVLPDTTAEELVRDMLDNFHQAIGARVTVPAGRGMSFYEVLSLASIVEREAVHDVDRP
ncbi:MAG TPA: endolytic transglycosylase MltG, partial [Candidatus Limnocylindrales bacterium]|nr:endolytic transglycosylase MltG [Candidatus Limnocylindrales bacterium]